MSTISVIKTIPYSALVLLFSSSFSVWAEADGEAISLKLEMKRAIEKGNQFLQKKQTPQGHWMDEKMPALTALPLTALTRDPNRAGEPLPDFVEKGYRWLITKQKDDGGIYGKGLATYNTSAAIMALLARGDKADNPTILKARKFLVNQQTDWGNKGKADDAYDGGIGYGGTYAHSDMSNTYLAIEALHHSKKIALDEANGKQPQLDWDSAIQFLSRCQNLPETNDQDYASDDPENKGGFVYFPGSSKAGEKVLPDGSKALRSYGSMSYAGLLSLVYAELQADDVRVVAVKEWLTKNYTIEENPGLGKEGLYYYYHVMAKSLTAANFTHFANPKGGQIDWRHQLARRLIATQREDGSWINENSRWWENEPVLVTSYVVLTLEQIYAALPTK